MPNSETGMLKQYKLAVLHFTSILHTPVSVFVVRPTDRTSVAQGLVLGGSSRRAVAQTRLASTKIASGSVCIPLKKKRAPQAPGNKPSPFKEG